MENLNATQKTELNALVKARTTAKRAVTVAAKNVNAAVLYSMENICSKVANLEDKFCSFIVTDQDFLSFCDEHSLAPEHRLVSKIEPVEYFSSVENDYKAALKAYKEYVSFN